MFLLHGDKDFHRIVLDRHEAHGVGREIDRLRYGNGIVDADGVAEVEGVSLHYRVNGLCWEFPPEPEAKSGSKEEKEHDADICECLLHISTTRG